METKKFLLLSRQDYGLFAAKICFKPQEFGGAPSESSRVACAETLSSFKPAAATRSAGISTLTVRMFPRYRMMAAGAIAALEWTKQGTSPDALRAQTE